MAVLKGNLFSRVADNTMTISNTPISRSHIAKVMVMWVFFGPGWFLDQHTGDTLINGLMNGIGKGLANTER